MVKGTKKKGGSEKSIVWRLDHSYTADARKQTDKLNKLAKANRDKEREGWQKWHQQEKKRH